MYTEGPVCHTSGCNVTINGEINQVGLSAPQPLLHCESLAQ